MGNDNRSVIERYLVSLENGDLDAQAKLRHPDFVVDQPQTRERISGRDTARAVDEHYPGGLPTGKGRRVTGAEDRWIIDPNWVPRRIMGSGDVWFVEATLRYPDGSPWAYASILELRDGLIAHQTDYYAPMTEPPSWRAQWVTPMPEDA
jgi:ketosteroid isomerase-like protein